MLDTTKKERLSSADAVRLPSARGPLSHALTKHLTSGPELDSHRSADLVEALPAGRELLLDGDAQLSLWILNLIDVATFADARRDRVTSRSLGDLHRALEEKFESALIEVFDENGEEAGLLDSLEEIRLRPGINVAEKALEKGVEAVRQALADKSPYLAWEADPHTLLLARIEPELKRDVADIQSGEYGVGYALTHAQIYRGSLEAAEIDLQDALDKAPAAGYAFANSAWLFGRHRRLRGLGLGQLCLIEIDSVEPCAALVDSWDRAELPAAGRKWYDVHVLADEEHERVVREQLTGTIESETPWLADDVRAGARITRGLQDLMAEERFGPPRLAA